MSNYAFTQEQLEAINWADGGFFLQACPGSGKTSVVGARAARIATSGLAVAITSYTNAAVTEIIRAAESHGSTLPDPNFAGTLHGFLLRFVFHPFGHLVMDSDQPPTLATQVEIERDPFAVTLSRKVRLSLWDFHLQPSGQLRSTHRPGSLGGMSREQAIARSHDRVWERKTALMRLGTASRSDAMWVCREVLTRYPTVAAALAARFDELLIDEVQDTDLNQLDCIQVLASCDDGPSIVGVGDLAQSIYSFNGASPHLCSKLLGESLGLTQLSLGENWRSTPAICAVSDRFSIARDNRPGRTHSARSPQPELLVLPSSFKPADLPVLLDHRLTHHGLAMVGTVLVRTNSQRRAVLGATSRSLAPLLAALLALRLGDGLNLDCISDVESRILHLSTPGVRGSDTSRDDLLRLRAMIGGLADQLPGGEVVAGEWAREARTALSALFVGLGGDQPSSSQISTATRLPKNLPEGTTAMDLVGHEFPPRSPVMTVHNAKGMSLDAVLLTTFGQKAAEHAAGWLQAPGYEPGAEESRVAFVALSRARQYAAVALPQRLGGSVHEAFIERGFVQVDL